MDDQLPTSSTPPRPDPIEQAEAPAEPAAPATRPGVSLVVGIGLLVLLFGLVAAVGTLLVRMDACDSVTFRSERFGYCLIAPSGWEAAQSTLGNVPADRIQPASREAAVYIQAIRPDAGDDLEEFATKLRELDEDAGATTGEVARTTVAGLPALTWEVTPPAEQADGSRVIEVAFLSGAVAYRVHFETSAATFDRTSPQLQRMLDSWAFT